MAQFHEPSLLISTCAGDLLQSVFDSTLSVCPQKQKKMLPLFVFWDCRRINISLRCLPNVGLRFLIYPSLSACISRPFFPPPPCCHAVPLRYMVDFHGCISLELMLDRRLPGRLSPTWYSDDPDLLMFSVDQLTSVQFDVLACSGARLALLPSPWNFSDFVELAIGIEDNTITAIRSL